jgi:NAD(P)H-dependent FMN reductase
MAEGRLRLAVIVGCVPEGRVGPMVADWFIGQARDHADFDVDVVDLERTPAPELDRVEAAEAFVVVTPEYNHSFPGPLKSAIDSVVKEWRAKPIGFVCYGGMSGGLRAVEQLRLVFAELHAVTVRETVSFHRAWDEFDETGQPRHPAAIGVAATALLNQLSWWAAALRAAKQVRPYGS